MGRALRPIGRRLAVGLMAGVAFLPLLGERAAYGELAASGAEGVVQDLAHRVFEVLERKDLDRVARVDALSRLIEARADVPLLSRLALGRYWRELSGAQRERYQVLFRDVVMRNFAAKLSLYSTDASGKVEDRFRITGSSQVADGDVVVRSRVVADSGQPLAVDWRLRQRDDAPAIIDLVIEGVSLLVSQRAEFAAVIERNGIDGLLAELSARAGSQGASPAAGTSASSAPRDVRSVSTSLGNKP
ncbi:MAG: MlaC/ttg2D family ABC transporter substrate-binding protein [Geminicoccaceae bacterium]